MTICIPRHYRHERHRFECEIITPMFLGNADQEAELRAAPFKGLLRYWWRVTQGNRFSSEALYKKESALFGSPDEEGGGRSGVTLLVEPIGAIETSKVNFPNPGDIEHPEVTGGKTKPLNYLAGMGLIKNNEVLHSYIKPGCRFILEVTCPSSAQQEIHTTLTLVKAFAAIGSRSRNGWGSWQMPITNPAKIDASLKTLDEALDHSCDYPHCLGKDVKGHLLWKTRPAAQRWEDCMKDLADAYAGMRARSIDGLGKIAITNGQPSDRHLLGYPLTNHNFNTGPWRNGRHASGLRLLVRKDGNRQYRGYILHLPHLFSDKMWHGEVDRQKGIWKKVHAKLDKLMVRAKLEELI